jgi:hypothetical protein
VGYRSPRSRWNESTLTEAWAQGFLWNAEADEAGEPYFIHEGLVRLPIAGDDWRVYTEDLTLSEWIESFASSLRSRRYFGWGSHDCVFSSRPAAYLKAYEELINVAIEHDALLVSFSQAADLYRRSALAAYYDSTARAWNRKTRSLYRTRRFREIVRDDVERLESPVVVDLGSGGGALSHHLTDVASTIWCVDNAVGMLESFRSGETVQPVLGEVTDSTLATGSPTASSAQGCSSTSTNRRSSSTRSEESGRERPSLRPFPHWELVRRAGNRRSTRRSGSTSPAKPPSLGDSGSAGGGDRRSVRRR